MKDRVFSYLDAQEERAVRLLRKLLAFHSVAEQKNDPRAPQGQAVADCLACALAAAEEFGLKTKNLDGYAGLIDSGDEGEAKIGMLCHLDVVPAGEGWTHDPFAGEIEDGLLYGRGTSDDKGPFVSALLALAALKACGVPLKYPVRLIAGTCEETGSEDIAYCKARGAIPPHVFSPDASYPLVNTEKGIARFTVSAPLPQGSVIESLHGGEVLNMVAPSALAVLKDGRRIRTEGRAAHASTPESGDNAISRLLLTLCEELPDDPAYELLHAASLFHPPHETDGTSLGLAASEPVAGKLTANLGLLRLEDGNVTLSFDVRYPLNVNEAILREKLAERLRGTPFVLGGMSVMPPHHVPASSPLVQTLLGAYSEVTGREAYPIAIGGGTYVHDIDGGVAFGTVYPEQDCRIHSPDEFIRVKDLILNAKIFACALLKLQNETL